MSNRVDQLEYTVMELGSQVFKLKQELSNIVESQSTLEEVIKNIRAIMEDQEQLDGESFDLMTKFHRLKEKLPDIDDEDEYEQAYTKGGLH